LHVTDRGYETLSKNLLKPKSPKRMITVRVGLRDEAWSKKWMNHLDPKPTQRER
jgi:hypothetical protein